MLTEIIPTSKKYRWSCWSCATYLIAYSVVYLHCISCFTQAFTLIFKTDTAIGNNNHKVNCRHGLVENTLARYLYMLW